MSLAEQVKQSGIVGAGGAGFPTHIKLNAKAEWYLANGAECEPLMHKDRELMLHFAPEIIHGLKLAAEAVGATKMAIGVKAKNKTAIAALEAAAKDTPVQIVQFGDYYPAGDEYELVYSITNRSIPPAGIPLDIGVVVNNVETLYQIHQASNGVPVTDTFLTITGMVRQPMTRRVPIGMSVSELIELAGGSLAADFAVMDSGLLMGKLIADLNQPVTKTTGGLIVLPASHELIKRYSTPEKSMSRIGKSACDQCSFCTELCPRYLLGYDVQPHKVMRSLGFSLTGAPLWNRYALLCCGCGLCTLYACPESLFPREACEKGIEDLRNAGNAKWEGSHNIKPHPMRNARRVPLKRLMNKLGITQYDAHAGWIEDEVLPGRVVLPLQQHIGKPAEPVVKMGEAVQKGQPIARMPDGQLGATIHASISGKITQIDSAITIEKD
ncbi:4Fe-4S dicluster domain-containing protein [candidate division KSB1 bacterium]|nr:4Fe-4S dicluster domain-containing protein [candidate division KSB1 bacterium]